MKNIFVNLFLSTTVILILVSCRTIRTVDYSLEENRMSGEIRILQISDFHSNEFGRSEEEIVNKIKMSRPDIIVLTGDLFDERMPPGEGFGNVEQLLAGIRNMCPSYFVTGNHDFSDGHVDKKCALVEKYGIKVLHDEAVTLDMPQGTIVIAGIEDPYLDLGDRAELKGPDEPEKYRLRLAALAADTDTAVQKCEDDPVKHILFTILLAHRPEYIDDYLKYDFNLIFSGHAHGGQWRFPLINGIYAPRQGLFPKYAGGRYNFTNKDNTVMIVSRGLSYQQPAVPRIFNSPELVLVEVIPLK
jgi:uncharacterized protein